MVPVQLLALGRRDVLAVPDHRAQQLRRRLLGPLLIIAAGLGLLFVPMTLVALTKVRNEDTGVASSLLNVGQQVGGVIGLAILGTVAWSAVATSLRSQISGSRRAASP